MRKNATIDWSQRESARANLRRLVRRVLNIRGYPPEKREQATDTVLAQAEALGDVFVEETETAPPPAPERPFRVVPLAEVVPFENAVPVLELAAAAGRFSGEQEVDGFQEVTAHPERFEWAELPDYYRPRPGMFVARVEGESMNRSIPNGAWGLFRVNPHASRDGKIVLVQHRRIQDTDLGGHFTLKRYRSEKEQLPDGTWRHKKILLHPESDRDGYEPIEIRAEEADDLRVIAEWLGPIGE